MIGAIAGDIIGSVYEGHPIKTIRFELFHPGMRFTDDSVLTIATAHALMTDGDYGRAYYEFANRYPDAGYGGKFISWFLSMDPKPYGSFGNGSAMRVSPVAWVFETIEEVLEESRNSALPTHDHPEGIRGAQATAACIYMARKGFTKSDIKHLIMEDCGYDLEQTLGEIRPQYRFEVTCQRSVPEAIIAFLESSDYESAVRNAISLGGDSDTQACIAGAIAEAFWGIPESIRDMVQSILPPDLFSVVMDFEAYVASRDKTKE